MYYRPATAMERDRVIKNLREQGIFPEGFDESAGENAEKVSPVLVFHPAEAFDSNKIKKTILELLSPRPEDRPSTTKLNRM